MKAPRLNETDDQRKHRFYNSTEWKKIRKSFIQYHPICESCLQDDKVSSTTDIHHIIAFDDQPTEILKYALFTDEDNLLNLCSECHNRFHYHFRDLSVNQQNFFLKTVKRVKAKYDKMKCQVNTEGTVRDMATKASMSAEKKQLKHNIDSMIKQQNSSLDKDNLFE